MKRRRRARVGQEKRKSENRRPILKKLCAALLRSFRGQHSEKMKGSARGNWDPRKGQQPFRPNPNGVGVRTTTLRRLLIDAEPCTRLRKSFSESIDSLTARSIVWCDCVSERVYCVPVAVRRSFVVVGLPILFLGMEVWREQQSRFTPST